MVADGVYREIREPRYLLYQLDLSKGICKREEEVEDECGYAATHVDLSKTIPACCAGIGAWNCAVGVVWSVGVFLAVCTDQEERFAS